MQKSAPSRAIANDNLDGLLAMLDLCRQVTLSQRGGEGQIAWSLRLQMAGAKTP